MSGKTLPPQPETHEDIDHPLPDGTVLGYRDDHRNTIPNKVGQEIVITDHFVEHEDTGIYEDSEATLTYVYTLRSTTPGGEDLEGKDATRRHIKNLLLEDKYPWYLKKLPTKDSTPTSLSEWNDGSPQLSKDELLTIFQERGRPIAANAAIIYSHDHGDNAWDLVDDGELEFDRDRWAFRLPQTDE